MRFATIFGALAAVSAVSAIPTEKRGGCLSTGQATTIVNKFISILEGVDYNGQIPNITAKQVVAKNYIEYSDSILSLEQAPV
jgi:hypothetical protein